MKEVLENIFLIATEPVTIANLIETFEITSSEGRANLMEELKSLEANYDKRGLELHQTGGGYVLKTQAQYARWIRKYQSNAPVRLTDEGRITLAIIAYKQPIKRSEIEFLRGVECESVLQTLRQVGLIQVMGELSGAYLYGTTQKFLSHFNLNQLSELPPLGSPMKSDVPKLSLKGTEI